MTDSEALDLDHLEAIARYVSEEPHAITKSAGRAFDHAFDPPTCLKLIALARRAPEGWREIDSAPRDGTPILAWCVHPHARHATDDKEWCAPVVTQWIEHNGGGWTWNGMAGSFTHWHPLPAPPGKASQ